MRAVVTSEARFWRTPDGSVWTRGGPARSLWRRYLVAFDEVRVVGRVRDVPEPPECAGRVDGESIRVWPVPYYLGPREYLRRWTAVRRAVQSSADDADAVILHVPSPIGGLLAAERRRRNRPYALEVVGDPGDVFAPGVVDHPLRPLLRVWSAATLRRQCRYATAVSYVTERTLQSRYPAGAAAVTTHFSNVDLPADAFVAVPRTVRPTPPEPHLICIGSLAQLYKGVDTLIDAVARLCARGRPVRLTVVGDGRYGPFLRSQAARLGLTDRIRFTIAGSATAIRQLLDEADLFVLASRTEGLPRALIEAMARALPAVASTAGGIPELLPPGHLVPPNDPDTLAAAIRRMLDQPALRAEASATNLRRAGDFAASVLGARRAAFYEAVRERNQAANGRTRPARAPATPTGPAGTTSSTGRT